MKATILIFFDLSILILDAEINKETTLNIKSGKIKILSFLNK